METITVTRLRGHKYSIFPTGKQATFLHRCLGCTRKLYNLYVEEGRERDARAAEWHEEDPEGREGESYPYEWRKASEYKKMYPYLKEADSLALSNARVSYFEARSRYFEGKGGSPNFKSKSDYPRSYTTNNQDYGDGKAGTLYVHEDEENPGRHLLHLPKLGNRKVGGKPIGDIPILLHRPVGGTIRKATIKYNADGTWTASLLVEETVEVPLDEEPALSEERLERFFGGDLGLKCFLTGTDGISYDDPGDYGKLERRLKTEKRKLGKQQARLRKQGRDLRGCKNYQKQRRKVARLEARIANKRRDFRHKLSRTLVNSHDLLVFEDLNVKGLLKNHCLARGVSEAAWSDFLRMVKYKAEGEGKLFVRIDRFFASTQLCSCCGEKTGPRGLDGLDVREWECPECGAVHDRDENAAWNVLFEGVRELVSSGGGSSAYWWDVLVLLCGLRTRDVGSVVSPTAGTAGVARVEAGGMAAGDPGVYTELPGQACLSLGGLGELGVSGKGCQPTAVSFAVA